MHDQAKAQFYVTGSTLLAAATTVESYDAESAAVLRRLSEHLLSAACAGQIPGYLSALPNPIAVRDRLAGPRARRASQKLAEANPAAQELVRSTGP
jgi:hypothetical protein